MFISARLETNRRCARPLMSRGRNQRFLILRAAEKKLGPPFGAITSVSDVTPFQTGVKSIGFPPSFLFNIIH